MPETRPPIELQGLSLADLQRLIDERQPPPVDQWNPKRCGHSDMRIARDGTWYHQGSAIRRPEMVRLFTTVLRREPDGRHMLVTPVEKLEIDVEGTAFRAVEMASEGEGRERRIAFKLDSGDAVILGPDHPLLISDTPRILRPPRARGRTCAPCLLRACRDRSCREPPATRRVEQRPVLRTGLARMTLAERLGAALSAPPAQPPLEGDAAELTSGTTVPAAVLIAITDRAEPGLILTVRREHLRTHAGQIAFPGGRIDEAEDALAAALREADEELGLPPDAVELVGAIEEYRTVTGYIVTPVIGVIPPDLPLYPHEHEVADWFEGPLAHLLDPANQHRKSALFQGRERHYYEIMWDGRRIWGATAAMIVNLSRRLQWS